MFFQSSIVATSPTGSSSFEAVDITGSDPNRIPPPRQRRIHFADDKGEKLVHEKLIARSPPYPG